MMPIWAEWYSVINADTVMSEITKVLNSNGTLSVDEHLLVTVGSIDLPKGGSGNKLPVTYSVGNESLSISVIF